VFADITTPARSRARRADRRSARRLDTRSSVAILAAPLLAATALVGPGALAQGSTPTPTIDPATCTLQLDPAEQQSFDVTVTIPGIPVAPRADIYILADTTGSMTPVLDVLKAEVSALVNSLFSIPGADLRIGIGAYRDFPLQPQNQYAFDHRQSMTTDPMLIQNAVDSWNGMWGGDQSEAGFYALERLAVDPATDYGWRPDAQRIIVWFGDAPSHDPVCTQLTGLANDVTEDSVIAALTAANTTVIAITTPTNLPMGLNDNPGGVNATGYASLCPQMPRGTVGQATRIAAATGGIDTSIANSADIKQAIEDSLNQVLLETTVALAPEGGIVPYVTGISPGQATITVPDDPNETVEVVFTVEVEGGPCIENSNTFSGGLRVVLGGQATDVVKDVVIEQNACMTVCMWGIGVTQLDVAIGDDLPGSPDRAYVLPSLVFPVLMDQIPDVVVPNDPAFVGMKVYSQIMMFNPYDYPADPLQTSNAICYTIGGSTSVFGTESGIVHFPTAHAELGECLGMGFAIQ